MNLFRRKDNNEKDADFRRYTQIFFLICENLRVSASQFFL